MEHSEPKAIQVYPGDAGSSGLVSSEAGSDAMYGAKANPPQATNLIYISQQDLAPVLQHFQTQQLVLFQNIARQQNWLFTKSLLGILLLLLLLIAGGAWIVYNHFQPVEQAKKAIAENFAQHQDHLNRQFSREMEGLSQRYEQNLAKVYQHGYEGYQQVLQFLQKLQKDYHEQATTEQSRNLALYQKTETLDQTVQELTKTLTKAELTILQLQEENKKLKQSEAQLKKTIEKQRAEIKQLRQHVAERLSPAELEKLKQDIQDDD